MSFEAIKWAMEQELPYGTKIVLLAIADFADAKGEAFPKIPVLAKKCGASRWFVMSRSAELVRLGLLVVDSGTNGKGQQRRNLYRLVRQPSSQQLPTELPAATQPSSQQLPTELPVATRYKEEPVTRNLSLKNLSLGTNHSNSHQPTVADCDSRQPKLPTGDVVLVSDLPDVPLYFPKKLSVVPQVDDPDLQELVNVWLQEWAPPLKTLYGNKLDSHVLDAWTEVRERGWNEPEDRAAVFRRRIRLAIVRGEKHSFASLLQCMHRWQDDLPALAETDADADWEDVLSVWDPPAEDAYPAPAVTAAEDQQEAVPTEPQPRDRTAEAAARLDDAAERIFKSTRKLDLRHYPQEPLKSRLKRLKERERASGRVA
jgi:hypothetical protein